jgi:hypothetical protein
MGGENSKIGKRSTNLGGVRDRDSKFAGTRIFGYEPPKWMDYYMIGHVPGHIVRAPPSKR